MTYLTDFVTRYIPWWGVFSSSINPKSHSGPSLVGCPRLLI